MQPRIAEVLTYFDAQYTALERTVADVPPMRRARRPAPDGWSVGEVIAHLALVEGRVMEMLAGAIQGARAAGLSHERETSAILPTFDFDRALDRGRPITAGAATEPVANAEPAAAWAAFAERHSALRALIVAADGLALGEVTAPHRVFGSLNAYQWVVFIGAHEARHAAQIQEAATTLAAAGEE